MPNTVDRMLQLGGTSDSEEMSYAFKLRNSFKEYRKGLRTEANLEGLEDSTDDDLKQQAVDGVMEDFPNDPDEAVKVKAAYWYGKLKDLRTIRLARLKKAAEIAGQQATPEQIEGTPGQKSKVAQFANDYLLHPAKAAGAVALDVIASGGKAAYGMKSGQVEGYLKQAQPIPDEEFDQLVADQQVNDADPTIHDPIQAAFLANANPSQQAQLGLNKPLLLGFPKREIKQSRLFGANRETAKEDLGREWETVKATVGSSQFNDESPSLVKSLGQVQDFYKQAAVDYAIRKLGEGAKDEDIIALADRAYRAVVETDEGAFMLNSPVAGEFAYGTLGDVGLGKLTTLPLKLAGKGIVATGIPAMVKKSLLASDKGKWLFRNSAATLADLNKHPELASQLRLAQDRGEIVAEIRRAEIAALKSQFKGLDAEKIDLLSRAANEALEGHEEALKLVLADEKLGARYAKYRELTEQMYKEKVAQGQLNRLNEEGVFEVAPQVTNYVPLKTFNKEKMRTLEQAVQEAGFSDLNQARQAWRAGNTEDNVFRGMLDSLPDDAKEMLEKIEQKSLSKLGDRGSVIGRQNARTGAEISRTGAERNWEPNAVKQWEAAQGKEVRAAGKAAEMKALHETGLVVSMPKDVDAATVVKTIQKQRNLDYIALDDTLSKEFERIGAIPGAKPGERLFVPREMHERIQQILALSVYDSNPAGTAAKMVKAFYNNVYKAPMDAWRRTHTILQGVPLLSQYFANNAMSSFELPFVGMGIKALNPKLTYNAAKSAVFAGLLGDSEALNTVVKVTKTGEKLTMGRVLEMARQDGVINQSFLKYALDLQADSIAHKVLVNPLNKVAKAIGADKVNQFIDDYQHLMPYLQSIEGTDLAARAAAMDMVGKTAGIYRRMSPFEKKIMREVLPFYAWKRTIYPIVADSLMNNPQRLQAFERLVRAGEQYFGGQTNYGHEAVPASMQMPPQMTSPSWAQPDALLSDSLRSRTIVPQGAFTMTRIERPLSLLSDLNPDSFAQQMGPQMYALASGLLGYDIATQRELSPVEQWVPDFGRIINAENPLRMARHEFETSYAGRAITAPMQIPMDNVLDLIKAYWDSGQRGEAVSLAFRVGLNKRVGGLDAAVVGIANAFGANIERETVGYPWMSQTVVDPAKNINDYNKEKSDAIQTIMNSPTRY